MGWFAACVLLCSIVCFSWAIHLSADPSGPSLVPPLFFLLVGSLTFLSPSLSIVSKTFSLPSLSLYLCFRVLTVSCRLTDFSRPCCIDGVKKASGENKTQALQCICCHQCPDLIFFKLTLTDGNISQFPRATVHVAWLSCAVSWNGAFHFTARAAELHYRPLDSLTPVNLMGMSNDDGFSEDYSSPHAHKGLKNGRSLGCSAHSIRALGLN